VGTLNLLNGASELTRNRVILDIRHDEVAIIAIDLDHRSEIYTD